jgi:hypothetical protein
LWTHSKNKCVPVFLESAGFTHRFQIDLAFLQQGKECTAAPLFTQEPRRVNPQRVHYFIHSEDYKERRGQNEKGAGDAQHPHRRPRRGGDRSGCPRLPLLRLLPAQDDHAIRRAANRAARGPLDHHRADTPHQEHRRDHLPDHRFPYRVFSNCHRYGLSVNTSSERLRAFIGPLFTQVRRTGVLGSSYPQSCMAPVRYPWLQGRISHPPRSIIPTSS